MARPASQMIAIASNAMEAATTHPVLSGLLAPLSSARLIQRPQATAAIRRSPPMGRRNTSPNKKPSTAVVFCGRHAPVAITRTPTARAPSNSTLIANDRSPRGVMPDSQRAQSHAASSSAGGRSGEGDRSGGAEGQPPGNEGRRISLDHRLAAPCIRLGWLDSLESPSSATFRCFGSALPKPVVVTHGEIRSDPAHVSGASVMPFSMSRVACDRREGW